MTIQRENTEKESEREQKKINLNFSFFSFLSISSIIFLLLPSFLIFYFFFFSTFVILSFFSEKKEVKNHFSHSVCSLFSMTNHFNWFKWKCIYRAFVHILYMLSLAAARYFYCLFMSYCRNHHWNGCGIETTIRTLPCFAFASAKWKCIHHRFENDGNDVNVAFLYHFVRISVSLVLCVFVQSIQNEWKLRCNGADHGSVDNVKIILYFFFYFIFCVFYFFSRFYIFRVVFFFQLLHNQIIFKRTERYEKHIFISFNVCPLKKATAFR